MVHQSGGPVGEKAGRLHLETKTHRHITQDREEGREEEKLALSTGVISPDPETGKGAPDFPS